MPQILESFLSERQKAKKLMEETTDPAMRAVLDGRQQALKTSANAIYGFTGATSSKLQCLPIAECTIDFGAQLMMSMKQMIEFVLFPTSALLKKSKPSNHHYCCLFLDVALFRNAVIFGIHCKVVYGDTDSLFVSFPDCSVRLAMEYGQTLAPEMTERLLTPIKLKFEKIYFPSLLLQKKRYAGLQWTKPEAPDKVDVKGVEITNRSSSGILRKGNDPKTDGDTISPQ